VSVGEQRDSCHPLVHVGLHKTGSTWLQQHVFPHLRGFVFGNHDPVLGALLGNLLHADDDGFLGDALTVAVDRYESAGRRLLLSHEALAGTLWATGDSAERTARRLASTMPNARVLLLTRNQPEMLLAVYAQYVNEGGTRSFERFLAGDRAGPQFEPASLEYDVLVELYRSLFGKTRVWVFPYERLRADPGTFYDELRRLYGAEPSVDSRRRVNVSLSPAGLAALRAWNRLFRASAFNPSPAVRALPGGRRVRNTLQEVVDPALRHLVPTRVRAASLRRATAFAARYHASNERLAELLDDPLDGLGYP